MILRDLRIRVHKSGAMKNIILSITAALVSAAGAQSLSIKGSDTLGAKLIPQLAEGFKASGKGDINFEIAAEGSSTAFPALTNGTAQIGMSSRKVKEDEATSALTKGIVLQEIPICHDMLVVIVNKNNPLTKLTKAQVTKIFTGQSKDWSEVGASPGTISIYTRNTSSGTYKDWQNLAMGGRDYPSSSQKLAGNEQIAQEAGPSSSWSGSVRSESSISPHGSDWIIQPSAGSLRSSKVLALLSAVQMLPTRG